MDVVMTDGLGSDPLQGPPGNNVAVSSGEHLSPVTGSSLQQGVSSSSFDRQIDHVAPAPGSASPTSSNVYSEAWRGIPHV
eukprot:4125041-Heterocapsa_arctica.AAC.1